MSKARDYWRSIKFSLGYAFEFTPKPLFLLAFLIALRSVVPYLSAFYLGRLIDSILAAAKIGTSSLQGDVWSFLLLYAIVLAIPSLLGNLQLYVRRAAQSVLQLEVDLSILKAREAIDIASYEDAAFQDLNQRAFRNGLGPIYNTIAGQYDNLYALLSLIIGTVLATHFDPTIYFIVILSAAPSFFVDVKFAARNWGIWAKDSPEQRRYVDLRQHIAGKTALIETKLLQSGSKLMAWIRDILSSFFKKQMANERSKMLQTSAVDILSALGMFVALLLLIRDVVGGQVPVGSLVYMISTLNNVKSSIASFLVNISNQYEDSLIVNDILAVVNTPRQVIEATHPQTLALNTAPEIVFENVGFKYPNSDAWILKNLNLTLAAGSKIGLVGNNGAGKTTFVKLLCRIYDPTEGRIVVNGIDLRDITLKEWWSYLGVMFQDYATYDFLAKEAIAISRPDEPVHIEKVKKASEMSQASVFIEEWKGKYDQQIGVEFKGIEPSKGQRQKLSIAKVVYRNARLMILDEPTASVDAESEAKIFDSLENLSREVSALLISHDFSTISQCDHIFVLERGELIEEGDHHALMKQKGKYAELYNLQAERFKK